MLRKLAAVFFAAAIFVAAAEVAGKWKGSLGERETVFTLRTAGSDLSGTMLGGEGKEHPLRGKLDGDKISFIVDSEWQGSPVKLVAKGTVSGDEMKLDIGTEDGSWGTSMTAKRQ